MLHGKQVWKKQQKNDALSEVLSGAILESLYTHEVQVMQVRTMGSWLKLSVHVESYM